MTRPIPTPNDVWGQLLNQDLDGIEAAAVAAGEAAGTATIAAETAQGAADAAGTAAAGATDAAAAAQATADNAQTAATAAQDAAAAASDAAADAGATALLARTQPSTQRFRGPLAAAPDMPVLTMSITPDAGIYNRPYVFSTPATWPVDTGPGPSTVTNGFPYSVPIFQSRPHRFMLDGDKVAIRTVTDNAQLVERGFLVYVNGAPVNLTVQQLPAGATFTSLVFPDARPRLIEILTTARLTNVYASAPYRCWKPGRPATRRVLLMGDSFAAGVTFEATATEQPRLHGYAHQLGAHLGCEATYWTDAIGGTGYLKAAAGGGPYSTRIGNHYALAPDMVVIHGGGANDLYGGAFTVEQIVTAATALFTDMRANLPDAKLVFVEGFAPPVGFVGFNDEYTAIRTALQAALVDVGVYYLDVATTAPWIDGTGYAGATTGVGNSDVYIGVDGMHPTAAGHRYIRERIAPLLRRVLGDDGALLNQLISS